MSKMRIIRKTSVAVATAISLMLPILAGAQQPDSGEPAAEAGSSIYAGWRLFQAKCATCHGPDATGTARGPNVLPRVEEMTERKFVNLVLRRYDWTISSGEQQLAGQALIEDVLARTKGDVTMPAWENEPSIKANIPDLYAYLKARANGALGPGRPTQ